MTNEEAISILKNVAFLSTKTKYQAIEEAVNMAITALKTDGDCISRQAAIDIFDDYNVSVENGELEAYSRDRKRLCDLPSVHPEPSTEIQEILDYLDTTLHPIVSPDNWNVYAELHDMVSSLSSVQPERKKDTVQKFHDYQVEWLLSHCDLELEPQLEEWVVHFLHDTANCYMMEIDRKEGE